MSEVQRRERRRAPARNYCFKAIGVVRSPFKNPEDLPPPALAPARFFDRVTGEIAVFEEFAPGLQDVDGFSHIVVLFAFHKAAESRLRTVPPGQSRARGIFATRSPHRPNPLGMTVVRVLGRTGAVLRVSGLDMIDGTPVLDIKPYTRRDRKSRIKAGWTVHKTRPPR
jgi:tRNA-Thr(GGU) m(6)t(6)A37 methyltransferase TsaA